jgi:hypothetical protein
MTHVVEGVPSRVFIFQPSTCSFVLAPFLHFSSCWSADSVQSIFLELTNIGTNVSRLERFISEFYCAKWVESAKTSINNPRYGLVCQAFTNKVSELLQAQQYLIVDCLSSLGGLSGRWVCGFLTKIVSECGLLELISFVRLIARRIHILATLCTCVGMMKEF